MLNGRLLTITLLALLTALAIPAAATADPPSNDNRDAARVIAIPQNVTGTTVEATDEVGEPTSACVGSKHSVWYRVPGNGRRVTASIEAEGEDLDAVIDVFAIKRSEATPLDCAPTDKRGIGIVSFRASSGTDYLIRVAERTASVAGKFALHLAVAADPAKTPGKRLPSGGVSSSVNLASNPSDTWSVNFKAGVTYRVNLVSSNEEACVHGAILERGEDVEGSAAKRLSCDDGYTLFTPRHGQGGRYTIVVESANNTLATQRYHLQAGRAQRDDTGPGLRWPGTSVRGSLSGGHLDAEDLYSWKLTRTANVSLRVKSRGAFEVLLMSPGGRRLGCTCDGGISRRLKPGNYFALVYSTGGSNGSYTLKRTVRTITHTFVTFNGSKQALARAGSSVHLRATVTPPGSGKLIVTLERKDPTYGWQYFQTYAGSGAGGGLSVSFTPPGIGEWRARAEFKGSHTANPSSSGWAKVSIRE